MVHALCTCSYGRSAHCIHGRPAVACAADHVQPCWCLGVLCRCVLGQVVVIVVLKQSEAMLVAANSIHPVVFILLCWARVQYFLVPRDMAGCVAML